MRKRTSIWLDEADRAAIATIQVRYGVATESDSIHRFAQEDGKPLPPPRVFALA